MNGSLLLLLDAFRDNFGPEARFIIHCGFDPPGTHSPNSLHYTGDAVDFHVDDGEPYPLQIAVMEKLIHGFQVADRIGFGIYPRWHQPGFHLDLRGEAARWGYVPVRGGYISYGEARAFANFVFKEI